MYFAFPNGIPLSQINKAPIFLTIQGFCHTCARPEGR